MTLDDLAAIEERAEDYYRKGNFVEAELHANNVLAAIEGAHIKTESTTHSDGGTTTIQSLRSAALIVRAKIQYVRGDIHSSLRTAELAYALAEEHSLSSLSAKALNTMGIGYEMFSDHTRALECLHRALEINIESDSKEEVARNYGNVGLVYSNMSDYNRGLEYYYKSLRVYEEIGDTSNISGALINLGNAYYNISDYVKSLECHEKAQECAVRDNNTNAIAACLHNIGRVYSSLMDNSKALEYFLSAMAINKESGNKAYLANNLDSIGAEYQELLDNTSALEYYFQSLALNEEMGNKDHIAINLTNIGWLYYKNLSDYDKAKEFTQRALSISEEIGSRDSIGRNFCNLGVVYGNLDFGGYDAARAEEYLLASLAISRETGNKKEECESCMWLADFYKNHKRWEESYEFLERYTTLEKSIVSEEARRQAGRLEQTRQQEARERQIVAERARYQERESILNNILPEEITSRLIRGENPIADYFDSVSVLFMDIVDFTVLSSQVSAQQLVYLLNTIFTAADGVMHEFGLEKIKTIGDAYMAVAGAPVIRNDHALRASHAALKLLDVMSKLTINFPESYGDTKWIKDIPEIQVRIGLHCGPAAAGVVGESKFLYDLWGDAVNTASRMESHGEAGKIHCSLEFINELQRTSHSDKTGFRIYERGEIDIKGKGMMRTYFLDRIDA